MRIQRDGIEYATWTFTGAPPDAAPPQAEFYGAWYDMAWVDFAGDERRAQILVAGPAASSAPPAAVRLTAGRVTPRVRLVDNPETVIRDGTGSIDVG